MSSSDTRETTGGTEGGSGGGGRGGLARVFESEEKDPLEEELDFSASFTNAVLILPSLFLTAKLWLSPNCATID